MKNRDPRNSYNRTESRMMRTLDGARIYDLLIPAIKAVVQSGGGADQILKKSEVLAVLKIVELIDSEKPDVALKAAIEVANRSLGKPVERSLNIYGDISKMNERDIDNQILRAIDKAGAQQLIEAAVEVKQLPVKKIKQSRKPRKSDPLADVNPDPNQRSTEEPSQDPIA